MDVSHLADRPKDGSFNLEAYEKTVEHKPNHGKLAPKVEENKNGSADWSSESDDGDDSDHSDSDESMDEGKHKKKNKQLNPKKATVG